MKKDADVKVLVGGRGSGKTTGLSEYLETAKRAFVLDPLDDIEIKGFKKFKTLKGSRGALAYIKANWNNGWKIILSTGYNEKQCRASMEEIVEALIKVQQPYKDKRRHMKGKEIIFCVDEADLFVPNPPSGELKTLLDTLILRGRHWGIELILATQSLPDIWTKSRKNAMHVYVYRQTDHNDLEAVLSMIGKDQRSALMGLKTHEYLHLDKKAGLKITKGKNKCNFKKRR